MISKLQRMEVAKDRLIRFILSLQELGLSLDELILLTDSSLSLIKSQYLKEIALKELEAIANTEMSPPVPKS